MLAKIRSCSIIGICGELVDVVIDLTNKAAAFEIEGLSGSLLTKMEERIRLAIQNSGYCFPSRGIRISIFPSHLFKASTAFDLPIALGVLLASGQINLKKHLDESIFLGELSSDGSLHHTSGILPLVSALHEKQIFSVYVPASDALEASLVPGNNIYPVKKLRQLLAHLDGEQLIIPYTQSPLILDYIGDLSFEHDMVKVHGQEHVKRALEIAASGMHNLLMSGPHGAGKTFLARCIPSILPELTIDETLEITKIYSVSGMLEPYMPLIVQRPCRAPQHLISYDKLFGDGSIPSPGEMSLAHRGVLFLHELTNYEQNMQEALLQSLKEKEISISCTWDKLIYPANVLLVASMKPCPCGFRNDPVNVCSCSERAIAHYWKKISRPLLDCIDIYIEVPRLDYEKLAVKRYMEDSKTIRARVQVAHKRQLERFKGTKLTCNAEMGPEEVFEFCQMDTSGKNLLKAAFQQLHLSVKMYYRVLKVARTIADLMGDELIAANHVAEAIQYRPRVGI